MSISQWENEHSRCEFAFNIRNSYVFFIAFIEVALGRVSVKMTIFSFPKGKRILAPAAQHQRPSKIVQILQRFLLFFKNVSKYRRDLY